MAQGESTSIGHLVLIPATLTLGVTVLRLLGELQGWSKVLFNTQPGGGGGLVGIVWLVPVFGVYFALKLANSGDRPGLAKAAGFTVLGLLVMMGSITLSLASKFTNLALLAGGSAAMVVAMLIPLGGWRSLTKTLLAYAFLARVPVAIINFLSMRGNWGTHYEGTPPGFPADTPFWTKYLIVGLVPQVTAWIAFTVIVGSLLGIAALAILGRKPPAPATS